MTWKKLQLIDGAELRRQAEERVGAKTVTEPPPVTGEDPLWLLHELQVHQIELEMQYAELRQARDEVESLLDYDLVLMDVQMTGLNGFEATRAIREEELERGGHTPIVAMTAHAFKDDEEKCRAAGMDAYLSKPIDFKKSVKVIRELLDT